ncbi:MAG: 3-hydroxybutyryl-CoA dehydrogenase [Clostridia bacterium]|nr:3-hydroxybutyryl-CoA dehydrogenase [Clostridia bacterium]
MDIKKIMVVGAGQMGGGIAQVAAQAGITVVLNDIKPEFVEKGLGLITKNLDRNIAKGKLTEEDKKAALSRIIKSTSLEDAKDVDVVIEAAIENMAIKAEIFKTLDKVTPARAILATNTSSLPITEIAAVTNRPAQVIGMHFFNPVPVMKLVEIIRGIATSDEVYKTIEAMTLKMDKTPVEINDSPGFAVNRMLIPMINEAIFCVYEGVGTPEAIDNVMKFGANHPMGPIALADMIGLDTCLSIMDVLYEGFKDPKYRACPLLRKMVKAGWLGQKSGRGFYSYAQK